MSNAEYCEDSVRCTAPSVGSWVLRYISWSWVITGMVRSAGRFKCMYSTWYVRVRWIQYWRYYGTVSLPVQVLMSRGRPTTIKKSNYWSWKHFQIMSIRLLMILFINIPSIGITVQSKYLIRTWFGVLDDKNEFKSLPVILYSYLIVKLGFGSNVMYCTVSCDDVK